MRYYWKGGHWKILWNEWSEISSAIIKWQCKQKQLLRASTAKGQLMWCHPCNMSMKTENAIINCIKVSPAEVLRACKWSPIHVWNSVAISILVNKWLISLNCIPPSQLPRLKEKSRIHLKASIGNGHDLFCPPNSALSGGMLDGMG